LGGPNITWSAGRVDAPSDNYCAPDGNLPQAEVPTDTQPVQNKTAQALFQVFTRMGFTAQEICVLIGGGHAVGRAHNSASGYSGPWTNTPLTWSNDFFVELSNRIWTYTNASSTRAQYVNGSLMMLPSDIALFMDPRYAQYIGLYKANLTQFNIDFKAAWEKLINLGVPQPGAFTTVSPTTAVPTAAPTEAAAATSSSDLVLGFPIWQVGAVAGAIGLVLIIIVVVIIVCVVKRRRSSGSSWQSDAGTPIPVKSMADIQGGMVQVNNQDY